MGFLGQEISSAPPRGSLTGCSSTYHGTGLGRAGAGFASLAGRDFLSRMEADTPYVPNAAECPPTPIGRKESLCWIFEDINTFMVTDGLHDGLHITQYAASIVNWNNSMHPW